MHMIWQEIPYRRYGSLVLLNKAIKDKGIEIFLWAYLECMFECIGK